MDLQKRTPVLPPRRPYYDTSMLKSPPSGVALRKSVQPLLTDAQRRRQQRRIHRQVWGDAIREVLPWAIIFGVLAVALMLTANALGG